MVEDKIYLQKVLGAPVIVDNNGVALKSSTRSCHEHVWAGLGWVGSRLTVPEGLGDEDVRLGSL